MTKLRIIHIVPPNFGYTFSGIAYILKLIQHWKDPDLVLELFGSDFLAAKEEKGKNGESLRLWNKPLRNSLVERLLWGVKLFVMLILRHREYDIVHFHVQWWASLLSPVIVH